MFLSFRELVVRAINCHSYVFFFPIHFFCCIQFPLFKKTNDEDEKKKCPAIGHWFDGVDDVAEKRSESKSGRLRHLIPIPSHISREKIFVAKLI